MCVENIQVILSSAKKRISLSNEGIEFLARANKFHTVVIFLSWVSIIQSPAVLLIQVLLALTFSSNRQNPLCFFIMKL